MPFNTKPNFKNFVYAGALCCYNSFEVDDLLIGCSGAGEELCIEFDCCCAKPNEANPMKKAGLVDNVLVVSNHSPIKHEGIYTLTN